MASEPLDFSSVSADDLNGADAIPTVARTVVAFIGRTERGPLNEPITLKSFDDYRRAFGGHCTFSFVSHAVQHFFLHGGKVAIVVRVANRAMRALIEIPAGDDVLRLQARQPGSHEYLRVSVDYDRVERTPDKFNLVVQRLAKPGSQLVDDQELFTALSMDPTDEHFIVDALHESELVRLVGPLPRYRPEATRPASPGQPIPYIGLRSQGTDGEDLSDYDIIGSNSEGTGLFALDRCEQIDFICIPSPPGRDLGSTSFLAATRYCERRRALLVWDPPWSWSTPDSAVLWLRSSGHTSRHAVTYFPRVRPRGEAAHSTTGLPACGVVAGMLAHADRNGVWHKLPPADTTLKANLAPLVDVPSRTAAALQRLGVNTFVRLGPGIVALQGNVSLAGITAVDSVWQRLDAARLTAFVVRSVERSTRWVFTAPRRDELAADLERQVTAFFAELRQRRALAGATPEQAFFVRTSTVRTPASDDREHDVTVTLRIGFAPRAPNEFLTFDFRYHALSLTTEVVPVRDAERHLG